MFIFLRPRLTICAVDYFTHFHNLIAKPGGNLVIQREQLKLIVTSGKTVDASCNTNIATPLQSRSLLIKEVLL
jgi:hypothetical protein